MNNFSAIGRLGANPELRYFESGSCKARVNIAISRGKEKPPTWVPIVAWEKTAEVLANYTQKGTQIGITGRLEQERWESNGENRSRLVCVAERIDLIEPKTHSDSQSQTPQSSEQNTEPDDDDIDF